VFGNVWHLKTAKIQPKTGPAGKGGALYGPFCSASRKANAPTTSEQNACIGTACVAMDRGVGIRSWCATNVHFALIVLDLIETSASGRDE
jgi:hypothetical protein